VQGPDGLLKLSGNASEPQQHVPIVYPNREQNQPFINIAELI